MSEINDVQNVILSNVYNPPVPPTIKFNTEMKEGINIMYTNTDVLHNKLDELQILADNNDADIIAITETLLKNMPANTKPEDFAFSLKGYSSIQNYKGRGLCFFIKKVLTMCIYWIMMPILIHVFLSKLKLMLTN